MTEVRLLRLVLAAARDGIPTKQLGFTFRLFPGEALEIHEAVGRVVWLSVRNRPKPGRFDFANRHAPDTIRLESELLGVPNVSFFRRRQRRTID